MNLQRVIVGIDFSAASVAAAQWAAHHFLDNGEIVLVHAVHVPQPPRFLRRRFPSVDGLIGVARAGAETKLREISRNLTGDVIWTDVRVGRADEQLALAAREFNADLVVVGPHDPGSRRDRRAASTAERLVTRSPVPVLMATAVQDLRPRCILVALDDADVTPRVLDWAHFVGERFSCEIIALHVISSAVLGHVLSLTPIADVGEWPGSASVENEFRAETDRWVESLLRTGLDRKRISSEIAFGEAGQEILATATRRGCDLIVMGSRGAGSLGRKVLGSVASEVLRGAPCPVLVVNESLESARNRSRGPGHAAAFALSVVPALAIA